LTKVRSAIAYVACVSLTGGLQYAGRSLFLDSYLCFIKVIDDEGEDYLMSHSRKLATDLFLLGFLFAILIQTVPATAMAFSVPAGEEDTRKLDLAVDDRVLIHFTVTGGQFENTLEFHMVYPNGTTKDFGTVGVVTINFVCDKEGEYVLHFSNVGSSENKYVSLDYEIQHYIFGLPQMLFLTIIIALFCVGMVAAFVLMGKSH